MLMQTKTYIYHHDDCLQHDPGPQHPECAARVRAILDSLQGSPFSQQLQFIEAPLGTEQQVLLAHAPSMWQEVASTAPQAGRAALDADTVLSPGSLAAALRGVGAACAGVDALMSGSTKHAFCIARPPGHHATREQSMGFCVFNQIAIAALHAMQTHGLTRVAVVDFDVHHGNGTQDILGGKSGMLYISTHQYPHYPGTGSQSENRAGNIHNVPLASETEDTQYQRVFTREVLPELKSFKPELLLVSAGFDAHKQDPLAGLLLTESTYRWLGEQLREVAELYCGGRMLSVLEGGYNLKALGPSVAAWCEGSLSR
jgi:acetoin utilization deacetylase AcuC-like enzyme